MANKNKDFIINSLFELMEAEFCHIPKEDEIDHSFSKKYIDSKNKLLNKLEKPNCYFINSSVKKAATIAVTLLVLASSLISVDATRNTIVNFAFKIRDTYSQITSTESPVNAIKKYYSICSPEGFTVEAATKNENTNTIIWINDKDETIVFSQDLKSTSTLFNSENGQLEETIINGIPCLTCKNNGSFFCYWDDDSYRFGLIYPENLLEEFMATVVGNLIEE